MVSCAKVYALLNSGFGPGFGQTAHLAKDFYSQKIEVH